VSESLYLSTELMFKRQ